jgi:hypothetical protein
MLRMVALLLVAAVSLPACATASKRRSDFLDELRAYNDGVRWQNPSEASRFIPKGEREEFLQERAELEDDLRIGDYEVVRVRWKEGNDEAEVHVKYTWHLDSRGIVHKTTTRQDWKKVDGSDWVMVEERRLRGDPMPGVAEPISPEKRRNRAQSRQDPEDA